MIEQPILSVVFFRTEACHEPVREWLRKLEKTHRKVIGEDVKLVQFRWPLGMPLVRKIESGLWEVRSQLGGGLIARIFFTTDGDEMVLLHGYFKKSKKAPLTELKIARRRKDLWLGGQHEQAQRK